MSAATAPAISPNDDIDACLYEAAKLIAVQLATFGQTFLRAQHARDEWIDISRLSIGLEGDSARIHACFEHAHQHGFLRQLFIAGCEENIAGVAGSPTAERFARLAKRLCGIAVTPVGEALHDISPAEFRAEAVNADGFDTEPIRLLGQVAATMRAVCLIVNRQGGRGTGVLVAPHIVATAAHVVEGLVDVSGKAIDGSAADLEIRKDVTAGMPGAAPALRVADDWLVDISRCPTGMVATNGRGGLPAEADLIDADDLVLIRLAEAPGFLRGWMEFAEPDGRIDENRRGLTFQHHPGGADQKVSFGRHCGYYGPRFQRDCTSLAGSSGGPVLDARGRLVGVHHGTVRRTDATEGNLGGGGSRLIAWRNLHKGAFEPPSNPVWEIRKGGRVTRCRTRCPTTWPVRLAFIDRSHADAASAQGEGALMSREGQANRRRVRNWKSPPDVGRAGAFPHGLLTASLRHGGRRHHGQHAPAAAYSA